MKIVWRHRGVPNLRRQISQLRRLPSPPLPLATAAVAAAPRPEVGGGFSAVQLLLPWRVPILRSFGSSCSGVESSRRAARRPGSPPNHSCRSPHLSHVRCSPALASGRWRVVPDLAVPVAGFVPCPDVRFADVVATCASGGAGVVAVRWPAWRWAVVAVGQRGAGQWPTACWPVDSFPFVLRLWCSGVVSLLFALPSAPVAGVDSS
jgi:hypothetical protein